jgi:ubiquinone/menaquinone biosynthesis C-methylase UbiE
MRQRYRQDSLTSVRPDELLARHNEGMETPWLLDELAHAGLEHLDPAFVAGYDRKAGYTRPEGTDRTDGTDPAEDLAVFRAHGLDQAATLVDLGAGTGRLALAAAREFRRVIAVDVSPAMVRTMRAHAADAGLANIDCVEAGFLTYAHTGPLADGVYTRNALHQLPDFWKAVALDRIARVLRPHGVLRLRDLIYDFRPSEHAAMFERWLERATDDPTQGYTRADLAEHIRGEHSTFSWLLEPMLAAAGFRIVSAEFRQSVYGAYTCVKA